MAIPRFGVTWSGERMTRALILGGGGFTGIAWELGILKGLRDEGVDLTDADVIIGTSAGSVVGTRLAIGLDLDELYAEQVRPPGSGDFQRMGGARLDKITLAKIGRASCRERVSYHV